MSDFNYTVVTNFGQRDYTVSRTTDPSTWVQTPYGALLVMLQKNLVIGEKVTSISLEVPIPEDLR